MKSDWIDIYDLLLAPLYFFAILFHAYYIRNLNIRKYKYYKYFIPATICKLIGAIGLCIVYTFYYKEGGDATNYFLSSQTFVKVFLELDFPVLWKMFMFKSYNIFETGFTIYETNSIQFANTDYYALFTVAITVPFCLLGCQSFICTTMLVSYFCLSGLIRLYKVFIEEFPELEREFAISIFFIPSVFFWGSGLLKDTYSLSAIGFFTYGVYNYFIKKRRKSSYLIMLIAAAIAMISIKPYIFFALMPGSLVWIFFKKITNIRNPLARVLALPLMFSFLTATLLFSMQYLADYLGEYSMDKVLDKAVKTQQDLIRGEQYGGNNFDIGKFDATVAGIASKIPVAINLALFRPYLWHARNPVMLLSGIENLLILGFSLYIILSIQTKILLKSMLSNPTFIFSFLFALFFAFSVGLTTANYGALVRLKIPCIPFYVASLFILYHINKANVRNKLLKSTKKT
jgi:hypothetical protein